MSSGDTCEMFPGYPEKCTWLLNCKRISASLSIVGCVFTIFIIWLFDKYKEFTQRMIIHLSMGTLLQAFSYIMVDIVSEPSLLCIIQGALMQFVAWVILLWILAIIINLLFQVMTAKRLANYEVQISIFCWLFPVVLAAAPFADNAYAPAGAWCWLKNTWEWRFGTWYIWSIVSEVFIFVSIVLITYKLRQNETSVVGTYDSEYSARHRVIKEAVRTLRVYPIAYFLVILFPTINRIQNAIHGSHGHDAYVFPLVLMHSLTDPLDGGVITMVFVMDRRTRRVLSFKRIREAWKKKFQKKVKIHEFKLKSRLSGSDFIIAARLSVTSLDMNSESDVTNEKDPKKKDKAEGTMATIPEMEDSIEVVIKRKREPRRRVSICLVKDIEAYMAENQNQKDGNGNRDDKEIQFKIGETDFTQNGNCEKTQKNCEVQDIESNYI